MRKLKGVHLPRADAADKTSAAQPASSMHAHVHDDGVEANSIFLQGDTNISRKYTVGINKPSLAGNPGDIVFNANPESGKTIGWSYTIENGWYPFGGVSGDKDQDIQFVDKLGVATNSLNSTLIPATLQVGSGSSIFHVDGEGKVGVGTTANGAGLRVSNGNIIGTFVGDGRGITNLPNDSLWVNNSAGSAVYPGENQTVGVKNTNPDTSYSLHVGTNNTGASDLLVENISRFDGTANFNSNVNVNGRLAATNFYFNDPSSGILNTNTLTSNDIEVGTNILSVKSGGGVAVGREDARADLDVDGSMRMKTYYEVAQTVTSSANVVTINLSQAQTFLLTTTEEVSRFNLTGATASSTTTFTIKITQGATGRSVDILEFRKVDGSEIPVYWNGSINPVVTTTASKTDIYSFMTFDGGESLYGVVTGQNFG